MEISYRRRKGTDTEEKLESRKNGTDSGIKTERECLNSELRLFYIKDRGLINYFNYYWTSTIRYSVFQFSPPKPPTERLRIEEVNDWNT